MGWITTVGIATRDRLPSLVACLESYLENCRRHARSPEFVIADDSLSAEAVERTVAALRRLANRFNAQIRYAGQTEKRQFADALAAESKVSREVVRFALFGDACCGISTGANRNCLLLDAAGELMLTVDDDTFCRIGEASEPEAEACFSREYDPTEFWFFADRTSSAETVSCIDVDLLGLHEAFLGIGHGETEGSASNLRIAMTLQGLMGDSGMASPRYYLTLTGASRQRLVSSSDAYRSAFTSREIIRRVPRPTISGGPFCMTTFLGLDNRLLLPPFFPVQRNSDGIFGVMLGRCVEGSLTAFLPWTLLHAPDPPRTFGEDEMWTDAATVRMPDIVIDSVLAHERPTGESSTESSLQELGEQLQRLGSTTLGDFELRIRARQNIRNFAFHTALQGQLHAYGLSPGFWAEDIRRMIDLLSKGPAAEDYLVARDLRSGRELECARRLAQELVGRFGEVLDAWPAMVSASRRLRNGGLRLAVSV